MENSFRDRNHEVFIDYLVGISSDNDGEALNSVKSFLQSCVTSLNTRMKTLSEKKFSSSIQSQQCIYTIEDIFIHEPRGRFKVTFTQESMNLQGKALSLAINWTNVSQVIVVSNNTSTKKEGEDYLALILTDPVKCSGGNSKELKSLLLMFPRDEKKPKIEIKLSSEIELLSGHEYDVIPRMIESLSNCKIIRSKSSLFRSMITQKPFLKCYKGIQEGVLYPLETGILFLKPIIFISSENIASLSAGRGGASSSTKYVDLVIETPDEKSFEFTNIEREELASLQGYVNYHLQKRKNVSKEVLVVNVDDEDDDDDYNEDEDEDYDDNNSDDSKDAPDDDDDDDGSSTSSRSVIPVKSSKKRKTQIKVEKAENKKIKVEVVEILE